MKINQELIQKIKKNENRFILQELSPFLKIKSNTLNQEGVLQAKEFIIDYIKDIAEHIKIVEGVHNPMILADVAGPTKQSLLIYMMYDTQPIDKPEDWISEPFGAEVKTLTPPLDRLGSCIIARGAYNSKTPLLCFLSLIKYLKKYDQLPISLTLLFDGEEEIGSPTLLNFLKTKKDRFENCVDVYYPAAKQNLEGTSVIKLGYKGILSFSLKIFSGNQEVHSSFSSMIPNPAYDLVSVLNRIYSNGKYLLNCFNQDYQPSDEEIDILNDLTGKIDIELIKNKAGISETRDKTVKKLFREYLYNPTFNISSLKSGFLGSGIKNTVPNEAMCKIDIRFAHDIKSDNIFNEIEEKVSDYSNKGNSHIEITKNTSYEGFRVSPKSILVKSFIEASKMLRIPLEIWPMSAAAAPLSKIVDELNSINFITGGLGIGGYAHAPNEFIQIESIKNARIFYYYFLKNYRENLGQ
ncbi:MAG: M20/M25/M40 family metallo-hydrolase [Candidatus Lokiarchaeota archaeon]|nr:M20/M25/M40 family metallo-hydrolase [Candidatus Lokiarchaeota archaeon]